MTHHSKRHISVRNTIRHTFNISMYILFGFIALVLCLAILVNVFTTPSHDRDWNTDQAILPSVQFDSQYPDIVTISNIRNFRYSSTTAYEVGYYDKTFNLQHLERVWYIVEPFSGIPGSAHTMLSFEFKNPGADSTPASQSASISAGAISETFSSSSTSTPDRDFVSISVEIRKEKGESFHPIKGLFNRYEIMYVIADEEDVVKLRSNYRKDSVYMYPVRADADKARALFLSMLDATQKLHDTPEFYNTITNTCTTNIVSHVNTVTPGRIPWLNLAVLFPASSDKLALSLGLLDTDLLLEEARKKFLINERALEFDGTETLKDFSVRVREF